jgi:hypothetical protein
LIFFLSMNSNFDKGKNDWPFRNHIDLPPEAGRAVRPPDPGEAQEHPVNPKPEAKLPKRGHEILVLSGTSTVVLLGSPPGQSPFLVASALVSKSEPHREPRMVLRPGTRRMISGGPGRPPRMIRGPSRMVPVGTGTKPQSRLPWWWKGLD